MSPAWLDAAQLREVQQAAGILRSGGLVAFPTETVYGLGADAESEAAVRGIFAAKGRPADHPVIVHLADSSEVPSWAAEFPPVARRLAEAFWPGPLTLILKRSAKAKDVVTGSLLTVGLRVPSHPVAHSLLREFGGAIAAPSANRFGHVSPTRAEHVRADFGDELPLVLDGGNCEVGLESTIVDCSGSSPTILRPGAITREQVEAVVGAPLGSTDDNATRCSGRLESHYAPRARVEIVEPREVYHRAAELVKGGQKVAILGQPDVTLPAGTELIVLGSDAASQARALYSARRRADELGCDVALVSPPAPLGLGAAVLDRLQKAAAPRPGFTLVELLVVLAIIGVLVALLLPAIQFAREAMRRTQCASNLKQIGLAVQTHHDTLHVVPPAGVDGTALTDVHNRFSIPPGIEHGWAVFLLPYMEQQPLFDKYQLAKDWRSTENQTVRETRLPILMCPSTPNQTRLDKTNTMNTTIFAAISDYAPDTSISTSLNSLGLVDTLSHKFPLGMIRVNSMVNFSECTDGLSNTLIVAEDAGRPIRYRTRGKATAGQCSGGGWTDRDSEFVTDGYTLDGTTNPGPYAINVTNDNEIYSFHHGGANVLYGDGSVHFLSDTLDIRIVARLITVSANEPTTSP